MAILRLMGLLNRPADAGCLAALRTPPAIAGLTDALVGLSDREWKIAAVRLEEIGLVKRDPPIGAAFSLDAHPLVREYFARQFALTQSASKIFKRVDQRRMAGCTSTCRPASSISRTRWIVSSRCTRPSPTAALTRPAAGGVRQGILPTHPPWPGALQRGTQARRVRLGTRDDRQLLRATVEPRLAPLTETRQA